MARACTFANSSGVTGHVLWTSDWEAQSQEMHPSIYSAEQAPSGSAPPIAAHTMLER